MAIFPYKISFAQRERPAQRVAFCTTERLCREAIKAWMPIRAMHRLLRAYPYSTDPIWRADQSARLSRWSVLHTITHFAQNAMMNCAMAATAATIAAHIAQRAYFSAGFADFMM